MKRYIPFIAVIALIGVLVLVNKGINNNAQTGGDDNSAAAKPTPPKPSAPSANTPDTADLPPEITLGNSATAKYKITYGWYYDEASEANPQSLIPTIQVLREATTAHQATASAEIVDLDVPASDLSPAAAPALGAGPGIFINGKPLPGSNSTTSPMPPGALAQDLQQRLSAAP